MKVIVTANEKGGVGKTTVTVTAAAGLAQRGWRVLMVDADPQGHATSALGLEKYPGLYDLLVRGADYRDVVRPVPVERYGGEGQGRLYVLGSNVETRHIASSISDAWALANRLKPLEGLFDVCLIDTSPTPSLLHAALYLAAQWVVYPTLLEHWSFDGLASSIERQARVQQVNGASVAGIVPVRARFTTLEHSENMAALRAAYGPLVWEAIPDSIVWAEAATFQMPVFVFAPEHPASAAARQLVDRMEAIGG